MQQNQLQQNHLITLTFLHIQGVHGGSDECVVCQESLVEKELGTICMLPCHHVFHRACLSEWLGRAGSCPTCALFGVQSSAATFRCDLPLIYLISLHLDLPQLELHQYARTCSDQDKTICLMLAGVGGHCFCRHRSRVGRPGTSSACQQQKRGRGAALSS